MQKVCVYNLLVLVLASKVVAGALLRRTFEDAHQAQGKLAP